MQIVGKMAVKCKRCGIEVRSFSQMRKWCIDCRKKVSLEQAKERKLAKRNGNGILKR
jgi:DNA-directed RNA polymerase subunit RPC12/RpoP